MPNGPTHWKITRLVIATSLFSPLILHPIDALCFVAGTCITLYLNPDLDLHHKLGAFGNFLGADAYQKLIPHRYGLHKKNWNNFDWRRLFFFSHIPFFGTLPRTLIVITPILAIFLFFSMIEWLPLRGILWLWLGMSYSDLWHVGADILVSDYSKKYTRYQERKVWTKIR